MKKQKVAAAIDFGTHGTGYAWALIDEDRKQQKRQIHPRMQWPAQPSPYPKNLTALLLSSDGDLLAWGYEARRRYNARNVNSDIRYVKSFKMSLAPAAGESDATLIELPAEMIPSGEAASLVTLYLKKIYEEALSEIKLSGFVEDEIRWCLTVPAMWGDYEKQLMRKAAVDAGLPDDPKRLLLAYEPEVAAHYARVSGARTAQMTGRRATLMSPGSRFLVADCGGGTVDITAYRAVAGNKLEEIGRECGGKFGSEYVNQAFVEAILAPRFGSYAAFQDIAAQQPSAVLALVEKWEEAKLHFRADQEEDLYIAIPSAIDRCLDDEARDSLAKLQDGIDDEIVVKPEEARLAFEEVVPGILALIDKQLGEMRNQRRNASGKELVVLVGGFGNSPYLRDRIQQHLEGRADIIVPPDPQVAVLFGAAHYACDPQVRSRRARMTYGCTVADRFRSGIDPEESKIEGPNYDLCNIRFNNFVQVGQQVKINEWVTRSYSPVWPNQDTLQIDVHASPRTSVRYVTEGDCRKIGSLAVDLSSVRHLPLSNQSVRVSMQFGETEIQVTAALKETGGSVSTTLSFEPLN
ncbi:Hsp70 family protein [Streptomyces rubiginosohelvolus]|uniref:Hsp70 family protein n=1 Tax=Streptomyces rubiginosohelvolus TaxID=67362 RepID=UPI0036ED9194